MRLKPRALTVLSLILLAGLMFWRQTKPTSAAESDSTTWGATDPTWSPEGARLGFSLFGSIWEVPSSGGEARQVSAGAGYHAHPAWSPKGDQSAFVSGPAPGGRIPNISGRLMIVDVATGAEREIRTPH